MQYVVRAAWVGSLGHSAGLSADSTPETGPRDATQRTCSDVFAQKETKKKKKNLGEEEGGGGGGLRGQGPGRRGGGGGEFIYELRWGTDKQATAARPGARSGHAVSDRAVRAAGTALDAADVSGDGAGAATEPLA